MAAFFFLLPKVSKEDYQENEIIRFLKTVNRGSQPIKRHARPVHFEIKKKVQILLLTYLIFLLPFAILGTDRLLRPREREGGAVVFQKAFGFKTEPPQNIFI